MRRCIAALALTGALSAASEPVVYDYAVPSLDGSRSAPLSEYRGKVTLIVNIGTRSQYAGQLAGLEALQERFAKAGFTVIALPSTDFGDLTPGSGAEIEAFCRKTYNATFPVFGKISVRGDSQSALYEYLTAHALPEKKGDIHWLFTKFLVDQQGKVIERFEPGVQPDDPALVSTIEDVIAGKRHPGSEEKKKPEEKQESRRDDSRA